MQQTGTLLQENLKEREKIITNSAIFFELLRYGCPRFRFRTERNLIFFVPTVTEQWKLWMTLLQANTFQNHVHLHALQKVCATGEHILSLAGRAFLYCSMK
jgi:hypothetical protein